MPRVLIATIGSLGDLNPMLAIGEQLLASGAEVAFATYASYERACHRSGFRFLPIGGPEDYVRTLRLTRKMLDQQSFEEFIDRANFDHLDQLYAELLAAADGADVLMAPAHVIPAHLVARKKGIPYVACATCLLHIRSPAAIGSEGYRNLSQSVGRWNSALRKLRYEQRLERSVLPLTSVLSDATAVLGVLPSFLLSPVDLRVPKLEVLGYADHRQTEWKLLDDELRTFCDERTVAFSFGSFADACDPTHFFQESVAACRILKLKCVYLSQNATSAMRQGASPDVLVRDNLAPGAVFPLVGTVVHHGGTGTLISACKSLKPMIIVPFFLDQPMQAARMQSLIGVPNIPAREYNRDLAVEALRFVLHHRARMVAQLTSLMADYSDGADRAAHCVLRTLKAQEGDTPI